MWKPSLISLLALSLLACQNEAPSSGQEELPMPANEIETAELEPEIKEERLEDIEFAPGEFNPADRSTWGTVIERDSKGNPTTYVRELPNGNTETLTFHHGWDNKKIVKSDNVIGAEYIHWNRPDPLVPLIIQDETLGEWTHIVQKYARVWSRSPVIKLSHKKISFNEELVRHGVANRCGTHYPGVIRACSDEFLKFGTDEEFVNAGGYARMVYTPDGHIVSAIVVFNDYHKRLNEDHPDYSATEGSTAHATANRNFVVCHELGHALGLEHFDNEHNEVSLGTCMDYSDDPWQSLMPDAHDLEELLKNYSHSHDEDQAAGVFCKAENDRTIRTYYLQRVSYNGVKAFAQTEIDVFKANPKTQNARKVRFDTEDGELVEIRWSAPNKNDMKKHTDGRGGEFPAMSVEEMRAKVTQASKYKSVEKKLLTALRDGEVGGGPTGCTKLTEEQAKDVSHFRPPKNGQGSGSYRRFQKTEDFDGSRIDAPDVEKIYRYVAIEGMAQIIADPVIEPYTAHEPAAPQ